MPTVPAASSLRPADLIEALLGLLAAPRQADFDARYCELVRQLCQADGVLMQQIQGEATHTLASSGDPAAVEELSSGQGASLWDACQAQGYTHDNLVRADGSPWVRLGLRLIAAQPTLLLLAFSEKQKAHLKEALVRAMLVKDIRSPTGRDTSTDLVTQASSPEMLELLALASQVMQAPHFGQAGLTLVNGLVRQLGLRQCALCWRKGQHAELIAISHLERFEKTSPLVHEFEKAAQEVLVVDRIIEVAPTALAANEVTSNVPPSHLALLKALQAPAGLLSIPIRDRSGETQAVVFCLPEDSMLPPNDINQLLLMLELVLPKLQASRQSSMGWLKRWQTFMLPHLQQLLGPGQPWLKFWSVLTTLTLLILLLGRYPYSVEATAQLTTDSTRILTSQNDGRLLEVLVDMGDWVKSDQVLSRMDTVELRQQELEIRSEIQRFQAEEEKAEPLVPWPICKCPISSASNLKPASSDCSTFWSKPKSKRPSRALWSKASVVTCWGPRFAEATRFSGSPKLKTFMLFCKFQSEMCAMYSTRPMDVWFCSVSLAKKFISASPTSCRWPK